MLVTQSFLPYWRISSIFIKFIKLVSANTSSLYSCKISHHLFPDPWLKKNKKAKKKKEEKKKKEKKVKKKKKKKEKEQDEDAEFDKALAAAGLLKKENPGPDGQSNPSELFMYHISHSEVKVRPV